MYKAMSIAEAYSEYKDNEDIIYKLPYLSSYTAGFSVVIFDDGQNVRYVGDDYAGDAPEDRILNRDLSWVVQELNRALKENPWQEA